MNAREIILGIIRELQGSLYADDMVRVILGALVNAKVIPDKGDIRLLATHIAALVKSDLFLWFAEKILKEGIANASGGAPASVWASNLNIPGMAPGVEKTAEPSKSA